MSTEKDNTTPTNLDVRLGDIQHIVMKTVDSSLLSFVNLISELRKTTGDIVTNLSNSKERTTRYNREENKTQMKLWSHYISNITALTIKLKHLWKINKNCKI